MLVDVNSINLLGRRIILGQFFKYLMAGAASGIVYFSVIYICRELLSLTVARSHTIAYLSSVLIHFSLNNQVTFPAAGRAFIVTALKYCFMLLLCYCFMLLIMTFFLKVFEYSLVLSSFFAVVSNAVMGYQVSRKWVFRSSSAKVD